MTHSGPITLAARLRELTMAGTLYERGRDGYVHCTACAHRCVIADGGTGACGIRENRGGILQVPAGYVARRYVRSVETNTIFHVLPGAKALTFGMYGCDLRCPYCHNWNVSQALREGRDQERPQIVTAAELVAEAIAAGCTVLCSAYNEPMITAEWARAVFGEAKRHGLLTALISDGNTTPEALRYMRPVTDVYRIDWKAPTEAQYRSLGGRYQPVFEAIGLARSLGYWVEVVTLVVPGFNDDPVGLGELASRLASVDRDIPWHLNAFMPRYKLRKLPETSAETLILAAGTAYAKGLRFVYSSNVMGVMELGHTRCPECHEVVIRRVDYEARSIELRAGRCPRCQLEMPGIWSPRSHRPTDPTR
jgi:pyruvate formate lyase activating enzyme